MSFWESLVVAILTSSFTVVLAMWRFQTEKWFTLKTSTYMDILKSLHLISKHYHLLFMDCGVEHFDDAGEELPECYEKHKHAQKLPFHKEQRKKIARLQEEAELEIDKIIDIASFIIKGEAIDCLVKIKNSYDAREHESYEDHIVRVKETIDNCYGEIKRIAKEDLEKFWNLDGLKKRSKIISDSIKESFKCKKY